MWKWSLVSILKISYVLYFPFSGWCPMLKCLRDEMQWEWRRHRDTVLGHRWPSEDTSEGGLSAPGAQQTTGSQNGWGQGRGYCTGVLRLSWHKAQRRWPIPSVVPCKHCDSPPATHRPCTAGPPLTLRPFSTQEFPRASRAHKKTMGPLSYQLWALQALVGAARSRDPVTPSQRGNSPSYTQSQGKRSVCSNQRQDTRESPDPSISLLWSSPIHKQPHVGGREPLKGHRSVSHAVPLALTHFHLDTRVMPVQSTRLSWITPTSKHGTTTTHSPYHRV